MLAKAVGQLVLIFFGEVLARYWLVFVVADVQHFDKVGFLTVAATHATGTWVVGGALALVRFVVWCGLVAALNARVVASLDIVLAIVVVAVDELAAVTLDDRFVDYFVKPTWIHLALSVPLCRQIFVVLALACLLEVSHHYFNRLQIFLACTAPLDQRVVFPFQHSIPLFQLVT